MTRLRDRSELPFSQWRRKWRDNCRKVDVLRNVLGGVVCYMASQNDSCFPWTTLNCTLWNTSSDKGGEASEAEPLQSLYNTSLLIVPGLCSQYGHASWECLYWKISCLSTWQTPSSLSEPELKINSLMASQSVRTSMRHKQAHTSFHACNTASHILRCI